MKIVFTICSNSYLAQAKILGDSIKRNNPDYNFFIGLVDKFSDQIDYDLEIGHQIILSEEIGIMNFDNLWQRYSIVELNTCVKAFFFEYFINKFDDLEFLYYFDPDIYLFGNLKIIEEEFGDQSNALLTPHILTPIALDDKTPNEPLFLKFGIYNLGFLGLKQPKLSLNLIHWWKERTYYLGYDRTTDGLFVDQLWFNLVPLLFQNVKYSFHYGLNMGPWNLHERFLSKLDNLFFVNREQPLVFYHFSNFSYKDSETIASYYNRFTFTDRKDLKSIYEIYIERLFAVDIQKISSIRCYYMDKREEFLYQRKIEQDKKARTYKWWIKKIVKNTLPPMIIKLYKNLL